MLKASTVPAFALFLLTASAAHPHEVKLADGRAVDYSGLAKPGGGSCCGERDCHPVDSKWTFDGSFWVQTDPEHDLWSLVPPDVIIMLLPEQLREAADVTHACWVGHPTKPRFYCVFPATQGS